MASDEFFGPPPPPPSFEREGKREPWQGPPENVLGGYVAADLVLARGEWAVITVDNLRAFPTGLSFELHTRVRVSEDSPIDVDELHGHQPWRRVPADWGERRFRFGVQFSDGSKATDERPNLPAPGGTLGAPILLPGGGGGGGGLWDSRYWLHPLPPDGPLAFVCSWLAADIPLSRVEVDAGAILEAADRAETLWPERGTGDDQDA